MNWVKVNSEMTKLVGDKDVRLGHVYRVYELEGFSESGFMIAAYVDPTRNTLKVHPTEEEARAALIAAVVAWRMQT